MPKLRQIQTSFVGGELDRRMWGRVDKPFYQNGASELKNVYVDAKGGVYRREGLRYLAQATEYSRVFSLDYSCNLHYVVVCSLDMLEIYTPEGVLLKKLDYNDEPLLSKFTLDILPVLKSVSSSGRLYLFHTEVIPIYIQVNNTQPFDISIKELNFKHIPWVNKDIVTNESPSLGNLSLNNLNAHEVTWSLNIAPAKTPEEGQLFIALKGTGRLRVTSITSQVAPISGTGVVEIPFSRAGTNTSLTLPAEDWEYQHGYVKLITGNSQPGFATFYQGRMVISGFSRVPDAVCLSRIDDYEDLNVGEGNPDDAIVFKIVDQEYVSVKHFFSGRNLVILTCNGEYYVPQFEDKPLTPETFIVKKATAHGCSNVNPISIDGSIIFVDKSGRAVREIVYNQDERSYNAETISTLVSHLIKNPIRVALRQSTEYCSNIYAYYITSDKKISVLTMWRTQQLIAWSQFDTEGEFLDTATIGEYVYFLVKRNNKFQIERLDPNYKLDGSVQVTPTDKIPQYANETLKAQSVIPHRFAIKDITVQADGTVPFPSTRHTTLELGYSLEVNVGLLPPEWVFETTSTVGTKKRIIKISVQCYNTTVYRVVSSSGSVYEPRRRFDTPPILNSPLREKTGWDDIIVGLKFSEDTTLTINKIDPIRFYIMSAVLTVKV